MVELITLAHLHTTRAYTPLQSNVLEAPDMDRDTEKEWWGEQGCCGLLIDL